VGFDQDYDRFDALGLAELIRRGDVKASEVVDEAIARVEARNGDLNAVVRMIEPDTDVPDGPFAGVPFLIKDLYAHVKGVPTTNGSAFFADIVPDHDLELVARYRRAGLVFIGKTNTPELGANASTEGRFLGSTHNPWNLGHTAGGSSGGAAAAVASGMLPLAHATDGGGSIRIPASCCGLFGLKPTRARNSMGPDAGEGWGGMSVAHAVSRSVRDSAALLDATAGYLPGDPYAAPAPARPFLDEVGAPVGQLRIALSTTPADGSAVDPECVAGAEAAARLCESLGHVVEEASPTFDTASLLARGPVVCANVAATIDERAAVVGRQPTDDDIEPLTAAMVATGRAITGAQYAAATRAIHRSGRVAAAFFADYDVMLTPTMAITPQRLGVMNTETPAELGPVLARAVAFTAQWNATGQPAMSVPLHWTPDGLPVGIQFAARFGDEATLFRLAAQLEHAAPWFDRRPPAA
jgi:Asp-tRNA(Asn)/Glu-tRNA(Gln) amidotransferase A subunit family amidase